MGFLDTTNSSSAPAYDKVYLPAGRHQVVLTELKWVLAKDKGIAVFTAPDGSIFSEWLNAASDGQKTRTRIFVQNLCQLAGVRYQSPADLNAFNDLGAELVAAKTPITLVLVADEWNGQTRSVLATKKFEDCILSAAPIVASDLDAF